MIWKRRPTIEALNERGRGQFAELLGVLFCEVLEDGVVASFDVKDVHLQPAGIMNGGVSSALMETVASAAANGCTEEGYYAVGVGLSCNHIRQAKEGDTLTIHAKSDHVGRSTQVWDISISCKEKTVAKGRLTLMHFCKPAL